MEAKVSWFGRGPDRYTTHGGEVVRNSGAWFAVAGRRVRGPMSCLDAAMDATIEMIRENRSAAKWLDAKNVG